MVTSEATDTDTNEPTAMEPTAMVTDEPTLFITEEPTMNLYYLVNILYSPNKSYNGEIWL